MADKTLLIMRHAKSSWSTGAPDFERPLSDRGRRDSTVAGRLLAGRGVRPDLVLCSAAARTRQTWQRVAAQGVEAKLVEFRPSIYHADPIDLILELSVLPEAAKTVLVFGHEPTMSDLVAHLVRTDPRQLLPDIFNKFPTSAIATLELNVPWARIRPPAATLVSFDIPRG